MLLMSDYDEYEDREEFNDVQEVPRRSECYLPIELPKEKKVRYKSTKDQTKRRATAIANLAKARATKKAKLEQEKQDYEVDADYSSDSDSEDLILTSKKDKKKKAKVVNSTSNDRLEKIEQLLLAQLRRDKKKKRPVRQTIVHVPAAPATQARAPIKDAHFESTKKNLLDL